MSARSKLGIGWLNENALRVFPFREDSDMLLSNGYRIPDSLILDFWWDSAAMSVTAYAALKTLVISTDEAGREISFTFEADDASADVTLTVPENAAYGYEATLATSDGNAAITVGAGLSDVLTALADGTYHANALVEQSRVMYRRDKQVNSVTGSYLSTAVSGDIIAEDGFNAFVDVLKDGNRVIFGAYPGAGIGANCNDLSENSFITLAYSGQPSPGDSFAFGGTTYVWGPFDAVGRAYLGASQDDTYAAVADALDAAIQAQQVQALSWATITSSASVAHNGAANTVALSTPSIAIAYSGDTLAERGDTFYVFGERFEFGAGIGVPTDAASMQEIVVAAIYARFTSALIVAHTTATGSDEFVFSDVSVAYSEQPAGGDSVQFYGLDVVICPEPNEVTLGATAADSYAAMVARLLEDQPSVTAVVDPGAVTLSGSNALIVGADFAGVENLESDKTLRAYEPCANRILYINGVHADEFGNLVLAGGPGVAIVPDAATHTVRVIATLNPDDLACRDC